MRSGGEILIEGLIKYGVSTAFCVPGESYLGALDAIYRHRDRLRLITCRHEGGASYMAEAWGKLTGQPGVCFASRGPGASNAMIGIHTAFQDSTPLICFIGQISRIDRGREAFQELDYQQVYTGVAKKVISIDNAERIPEQINQAWQCATTGRPGPVIVVLYEDMLKDEAAVKDIPVSRDTFRGFFSPAPPPAAIARVTELLHQANKPLIICGNSSWDHNTRELLTAFSEKHQIPVTTTFRRQDCFDNTHQNYIGELGLVVSEGLLDYLQQADLLLVIGPLLGDITTGGYQRLKPPLGGNNQTIVHVHPAAESMNRVYHANIAIVSHCTRFLQSIQNVAAAKTDRMALMESLHQQYLDFVNQPRPTDKNVRLDQICKFLRQRLPADTIITVGAGNYTTWAQRHYQYRQTKTQLGSTNGSMGYGVPAAIAAKLARPESTVVSFSGDGCFLMNGQELATAVQYQLAIIFLVINNSSYGTIRTHQERHYPGRVVGTDLNNPDFAALARAYGAEGFTVDRTDQFIPAFEAAMASEQPTVIEIKLQNPAEN
jgi:acetolactate synthase-1/2/3 large subunit